MSKLKWSKEFPKKEGWYFWRRTASIKDPWKYQALFVMETNHIDESEPSWECWFDGTEYGIPKGGSWAEIAV